MDISGYRDDIEGSNTTQFRMVNKTVWLAEACLNSINYIIISLPGLYVESLNMMLKLL